MASLKQVIEQNDTPMGRTLDFFIQALIVLSLVTFSMETLPDLQPETIRLLGVLEAVCVFVFTLEYLLRLGVSSHRLRFVCSFFGIIDLLAILPFYLNTGVDLRSVRALRLLRLFRAFKLVRYSNAIQRFHRAFVIAREELILFLSVSVLLLYLSAVGIYYFENAVQPEVFASVFDGMWWALITMTTVGYGDAFPITLGGRLFTSLVLLISLGLVAVPTGLLATALSQARDEEMRAG